MTYTESSEICGEGLELSHNICWKTAVQALWVCLDPGYVLSTVS